MLVVHARQKLAPLVGAAKRAQDAWLTTAVKKLVFQVETEIDEESLTLTKLDKALEKLYLDAEAQDSDDLRASAESWTDRPVPKKIAGFLYAPRHSCDIAFDIIETIAKTIDDAQATELAQKERLLMEKRIEKGTGAALLALHMQSVHDTIQNEYPQLHKAIASTTEAVEKQMRSEYS